MREQGKHLTYKVSSAEIQSLCESDRRLSLLINRYGDLSYTLHADKFAFDGERLIGFFALDGFLLGSSGQYVRLISLHVSHEYRKNGIGKELFLHCAHAAEKTGVKKMYISAHSSQESQAFYRAMGCVEAEEIDQRLYEAEPFDVHMEYALSEKETGE